MQKWKERKKERKFLEWKWPKPISKFFFQRRQRNTLLAIDMNENKGKRKKKKNPLEWKWPIPKSKFSFKEDKKYLARY